MKKNSKVIRLNNQLFENLEKIRSLEIKWNNQLPFPSEVAERRIQEMSHNDLIRISTDYAINYLEKILE